MDEILSKYRNTGSTAQSSDDEFLALKCDVYNKRPGALKYYDCPICLNKGDIAVPEDGRMVIKTCECWEKRRSIRQMEESGLKNSAARYTFGSFKTDLPWRATLKEAAWNYVSDPHGWFFVGGQSGCGKTHICTAICTGMIAKNFPARYFKWKEDGTRIKNALGTAEYEKLLRPIRDIKCLYIDDFFKAKDGRVSDGDVNLAFDIINSRYNDTGLLTVISSELSIDQIMEIDEAIGGRIYERSRGQRLYIKGEANNFRVNGG